MAITLGENEFIITNVIKYSPWSNKVLIHVARDQHQALLSVQDFGIGIASYRIPPIYLKLILELLRE